MGWGQMNWCGGNSIMMILFIILIAAAIYWLIKSAQNRGNIGSQTESALDIAKKRYARGEISKDEFEQMKKDLH